MTKFLLGVVVGIALICIWGIASAKVQQHNAIKERDRAVKAEQAAQASPTPTKQDFAGTWKIVYAEGSPVVFSLFPNDDALRARGNHRATGSWTVADDGAWITWSDGWRDNIQIHSAPLNRAFAPGRPTNSEPTVTGLAVRVRGP